MLFAAQQVFVGRVRASLTCVCIPVGSVAKIHRVSYNPGAGSFYHRRIEWVTGSYVAASMAVIGVVAGWNLCVIPVLATEAGRQ